MHYFMRDLSKNVLQEKKLLFVFRSGCCVSCNVERSVCDMCVSCGVVCESEKCFFCVWVWLLCVVVVCGVILNVLCVTCVVCLVWWCV